MKLRIGLGLFLLGLAGPAMAERLTFDHRLQPQLKQVLDSGDASRIDYNAANPRYVVDRIAVQGTSPADWTELLEVIARTPARNMRTAQDWMDELRRQADARCPNRIEIIAQDAASITFERRSQQTCAGEPARSSLYRVVAGKRSLFLLAVHDKGGLSETARRDWLAMLASAHLD